MPGALIPEKRVLVMCEIVGSLSKTMTLIFRKFEKKIHFFKKS
jgi:hypothetical protein